MTEDNRIWKKQSDSNAPYPRGAIVRWQDDGYKYGLAMAAHGIVTDSNGMPNGDIQYSIICSDQNYGLGFGRTYWNASNLEYLAFETEDEKEWRIQELDKGTPFETIWTVIHMADPLRCSGMSYINNQPVYRVGNHYVPADIYAKGWQYIAQYKETHEPDDMPIRKKRGKKL